MIVAYYILFAVVLVALSPLLIFKAKARHGLGQKLGFVPPQIREKFRSAERPIWFHSVSVGEFNALFPLLKEFNKAHPERPIIVSTTTGTGNELARERACEFATVVYFPYDAPWAVKSWLNATRPAMAVIVETEIWPGFIHECRQRNIPVAVVNGRMSPRSHRSYHFWRLFFGPVLRKFSFIAAQTDTEVGRYKSVGGPQLAAVTTGNLKFDGLKAKPEREIEELRRSLSLSPDDAVIVAGSTHEGEEEALLKAFSFLKERGIRPGRLKLVIAPRHPERFDRVNEIVIASGLSAARYSQNGRFTEGTDVYILDTIGKLMSFYGIATVAFVGGTIAPIGGHNVIEPYTYAVPVACGPHLEKTKDLARRLLEIDALFVVDTPASLADVFESLIENEVKRSAVGARGMKLLSESQGAVVRTLKLIENILYPGNAAGEVRDSTGGAVESKRTPHKVAVKR